MFMLCVGACVYMYVCMYVCMYVVMCVGLGPLHIGNTPKHTDKHTKHARMRTHTAHNKMGKKSHIMYIGRRVCVNGTIHTHGGYSRVWMVVWEHIWGWGTLKGGKEEHRLSPSVV